MPARINTIDERAVLRELAERERRSHEHTATFEPTVAELELAQILERRMFKAQRDFFFDKRSRRRCGRCTRRAGKTLGGAYKFLITLLREPRSVCLYLAKTAGNAREYIWPELKKVVADHDAPFTFNETALRMSHKRAHGKVLFRGADTRNEIEKHRGMKFRVVVADESGTFGAELEDLIISVIGPSLRDNQGELLLIGTPGYFPAGLFYEVSEGLRSNWINHRWSLMDNPYLTPDAKNLELIREEEGLTEDDPRFLREYKAIYALNRKTQMFMYDPRYNSYLPGQMPDPRTLIWYLGVDFGWSDATAIVPLGWSKTSRDVWVAEGWQASQQTSDDVAEQLNRFIAAYGPKRIIGDCGGLGKIVVEQILRDYGIYIEKAEKGQKLACIEFVNSAFRRRELHVQRGTSLANELPAVLWNANKTDAHEHAKDNEAMAMVYAWRQIHFINKRPHASPSINERATSVDPDKAKLIAESERLARTRKSNVQQIEAWYTRMGA